jgi:hypothetical protein
MNICNKSYGSDKYSNEGVSCKYCHVISDDMGDFDLFNSYTTRDYTLQITIIHRLVFSVTVFTAPLGSGFQQWTITCFPVHVYTG